MSAIIGLILRHVLTAGGAYLVTRGLADEATAEQLVGALSTVSGFVLSFINKKRTGQI